MRLISKIYYIEKTTVTFEWVPPPSNQPIVVHITPAPLSGSAKFETEGREYSFDVEYNVRYTIKITFKTCFPQTNNFTIG